MSLSPLDLGVDNTVNPYPDAPCPNCGDDCDITRRCEVGISVANGPRLCTTCINSAVPGLAAVLDVVSDLQCVLEEAEDPTLLAIASRKVLAVALQSLLHDVDWQATQAAQVMHGVPDGAA